MTAMARDAVSFAKYSFSIAGLCFTFSFPWRFKMMIWAFSISFDLLKRGSELSFLAVFFVKLEGVLQKNPLYYDTRSLDHFIRLLFIFVPSYKLHILSAFLRFSHILFYVCI